MQEARYAPMCLCGITIVLKQQELPIHRKKWIERSVGQRNQQRLDRGEKTMANSINASLVTFVQFNAAGEIDLDASANAFQSALLNYQETHAEIAAQVSVAVHSAFDKYSVKKEDKTTKATVEILQTPQLISFAMKDLSVTGENYQEFVEAIDQFVRTNPQFHVARGRDGGVKRLYRTIK